MLIHFHHIRKLLFNSWAQILKQILTTAVNFSIPECLQ